MRALLIINCFKGIDTIVLIITEPINIPLNMYLAIIPIYINWIVY